MADTKEKELETVVQTQSNGDEKHDESSSVHGSALPVVDLNKNESGTVRNPLANLPRAKLLADVEAFVREKKMEEHTDLFKRGALVAQNPAGYADLTELQQDEKDAIANEMAHKWSHPRMLYMTIIICSIGAATQGECKHGQSRLCSRQTLVQVERG